MSDSFLPFDSLVFGAREWFAGAVVAIVAVTALAVWSYSNRSPLAGLRVLTVVLKVLAVSTLAFCLVEPLKMVERPRPGANVMALVVDNSRSMEIKPPGTFRRPSKGCGPS